MLSADDAAARSAGAGASLVRCLLYWNRVSTAEPNSPAFLRPQRDAEGRAVSPVLYRSLVNAAAPALHDVDPTNVVIIGETAALGRGDAIPPLAFLRKLFTGTVEADVFSHHPYTLGSPGHHAGRSDEVSLGDLAEWARLVRGSVAAGHVIAHDGTPKTYVPLWVSELSWDSSPPDPKGVPAQLLARWTAEAIYRSWR